MASEKNLDDILRTLNGLSPEVQKAVLRHLRDIHPIHSIEADWNVPAEVILEAIARAPDLSQRGVRGLIAEAFFEVEILPTITGWEDVTPPGNHAFDFQIQNGDQTVRIQVKTQRRKSGRPMWASEGYRYLSDEKYVVETQRTRAGKDQAGKDTRPYRFGDFDILAVNMEPSTGEWGEFRFTLERWLLPRKDEPSSILKFQPVSLVPNRDWTDNLRECLEWHASEIVKTIEK